MSSFQRSHPLRAAHHNSGDRARKPDFLCSTAMPQPILMKCFLIASLYNCLQQVFSLFQNWSLGSSYSTGNVQKRPQKPFFRTGAETECSKFGIFSKIMQRTLCVETKKQSWNSNYLSMRYRQISVRLRQLVSTIRPINHSYSLLSRQRMHRIPWLFFCFNT